jgi:hypothetical protein
VLSDSILDLPSRCKGSSLPDVHNTTQEVRIRQNQNTRAKQSFKPGGSAKFVRPVFSLFCFIWNMIWSSLDSSLTCLKWPCNCQPHACKHDPVLLHGQHFSSFTLFPAFDPASCAFWQFVFFFYDSFFFFWRELTVKPSTISCTGWVFGRDYPRGLNYHVQMRDLHHLRWHKRGLHQSWSQKQWRQGKGSGERQIQ